MSYIYRHAKVERVIDGDTVVISVDMGNKITWLENFRLNGIDAADKDKVKKDAATAYITNLLASGISHIETFKPDKFGRWLVDIYVPVNDGELKINQVMVTEGYALPYFGGKKEQ